MKYLSNEKRLRWMRLSKERERHNLASVRKKLLHAKGKALYKKNKEIKSRRKRLTLPSVLCLRDNYDAVVDFARNLRNDVTHDPHSFCIDFTTLQDVKPDAALLLAAELDRLRRIHNAKLKVYKINKWQKEPRRILQELGLFELLEVTNVRKCNDVPGSLRIIKFLADSTTNGKLAKQLRESLEKVSQLNIEMSRFLYGGITEAMANVTQHAYPEDDKNPQVLKYWWLTGAYDASNGKLSVYMLDQGVGIPATLPKKYPQEKLMGAISSLGLIATDGALIEAALVMGRTKTEKKYRGRGLENIMKFVKSNSSGELRIISRYGEYTYSSATNKSSQHNHKIAFPGTLIHWQVNLKSEAT